MRRILGITVAIGLVSFVMASSASAVTLQTGQTTCSVADFTLGGSNVSACEGAYSGNDSNQNLDGIFNITGWTQIAKVNLPDKGAGPFSAGSLTVSGGGKSGGWEVTSWKGNSPVMAVLKGGPTFSAYLLGDLSASSPTSGTWFTNGILKGNDQSGPGLSHLTFYSADEPITPIPLPASAWMLIAGLGGFVAVRRRKASAV